MKSTKMTRMMLEKHLGEEPEENSTVTRIVPVLNYYSAFHNRQEAIKFFEDYMGMVNPDFLENRVYENMSATVGWIARMKSMNVNLPAETNEWFDKELSKMPARLKVVGVDYAPISDPFDSRVIAELEEKFDNNETENFDFLLSMNLSRSVVNKIVNFFRPRLAELEEISNNEDVAEAYKCFTEEEIEANIAALKRLMNTLGVKIAANSNISGRKAKIKTPEEITKWMVLQSKDEELGLKSLPASKIIGATTVVFYVTKHRTVQIFRAEDGKTFDVRGKSILNFDGEKSESKTIRKPEEIINQFTSKNIGKIEKIFNKLTTKARKQTTALISKDHMLLGAF